MKYRIVKSTYYDFFGEEKPTQYHIEVKKSFGWKTIKQEHYSIKWSGRYKETIRFETLKQAEIFLRDVVKKNKTTNGRDDVVVKSYDL